MNTATHTFRTGDFAIRFRIEWKHNPDNPRRAKKAVSGMMGVMIAKVESADSVLVSSGRKDRDGKLWVHRCNPRELIPVTALEHLSTDATHGSAEPEPLQIAVAGVVASA